MAKQPEPDVTKLPKWAQERISRIEHALEYAKAQIADLSNQHTGGVKTKTYIDMGHLSPKVYLPDDAEITFEGDHHNEISLRRSFNFQNRADTKTGFKLRTNGNDRMALQPDCTNVIEIVFIDREGKVIP